MIAQENLGLDGAKLTKSAKISPSPN